MSMRIQAYNQVQQVYGTRRTAKTSQTTQVSKTDAVEFSSIGRDFQTAKKAVKEAPDIREELTSALKTGIKNGTYEVSNESFADKLIEKFSAAV